MTNESKFVTVTERIEAFRKYCEKMHDRPGGSCGKQERCSVCSLKWLDLEAEEEKPLPCPFCDHHQEVIIQGYGSSVGTLYRAECRVCKYQSRAFKTESEAIAAHNRVAKSASDAKGDK